MWFLYRNLAVIHVFVICAVFAWLFGGIRSEYLPGVVPWICALLLEGMICFPQRHPDETTYEARERVWRALKRDRLTWVSLAFAGLLMIPFFNVGLCPICDYPAIAMGARAEPPVPFLPFCVNVNQHLNVVLWFVPALMAMVAVKHALTKQGKRLLLEMLVWNGVLLGVIGFVQQVTAACGPLWIEKVAQDAYFFSTFGYPNMASDYFTTLFAIAVGLWRWRVDEGRLEVKSKLAAHEKPHVKHRQFWKKNYHLIACAILFVSVYDTLSRASMMLVTLLTVVFFMHTFVSFYAKARRAVRVKAGLICGLALALIVFLCFNFTPENVAREMETVDTTEVLDRVTGKGQYHTRVAGEIWKNNILFGVGGWGYKHFCLQYMTPEELPKLQKIGGINVHNDHLQFLAEHGLVGFGLLLTILVMLVKPYFGAFKALFDSVKFKPAKEQPPQPLQIFCIPAPVTFIFLAAISTIVHAFGDCPMRSPAVLTLFLVSLAAADGFIPYIHRH